MSFLLSFFILLAQQYTKVIFFLVFVKSCDKIFFMFFVSACCNTRKEVIDIFFKFCNPIHHCLFPLLSEFVKLLNGLFFLVSFFTNCRNYDDNRSQNWMCFPRGWQNWHIKNPFILVLLFNRVDILSFLSIFEKIFEFFSIINLFWFLDPRHRGNSPYPANTFIDFKICWFLHCFSPLTHG